MKTSALIADKSVKLRWLLFLVSVLIFSYSFTGFKYFTFDSSPRAFFNADYPYLQDFVQIEDKYGKDSRVFVMLSSDEGSIYTEKALTALLDMTEQGWLIPHSIRVDSLANHQHSFSDEDELLVEPLYESAEELTVDNLKRIEQIASTSPSIVDRLVTENGSHASLTITLSIDEVDQQAKETETALAVYELRDEMLEKYPGIKLNVTGNVISNYHNLTIATGDIALMVPVMFALMFVMIGALMRSITGVFVSLIIAIMATIGALGYSSMIGTVYSTLAINAVIIAITVSIAHCIHIITYFLHSYFDHDKFAAIQQSLKVNFVPVTITSLTTGLGFLSLNFSELPPAAHLGNASAIAVFLAWLFSYTVLPALLGLLPVNKPKQAESGINMAMLKLADWVIARRNLLLVVTSLFAASMLVLAMQNVINDRFSEIIKKPHEFRTDNEAVDQYFGGLYNVSYDMIAGEEQGITQPQFIVEVDRFVEWLRQQPEVSSVNTYTDTLKRLNKNMHGDNQDYYRIPESQGLAAQLLLLYEMSVPQGVDLNNIIALDKSSTRVLITLPSMDTEKVFAFQEKVAAWQAANLPESLRDGGASLAIMWSHLSIDSLVSSIEGSFVALAIISLILMLVLKSFRYGLVSVVPNIIPAAVGFGIWALISGELGIGLTSVVIITIGIIVDDTVHFLSKYQKARSHDGLSSEDSVRYAFKHVGTPLWITTAALASGFSILTLSKVHGNSDLGLLTSIILLAALILDFLLLPALLMFIDRDKRQQA